MMILFDYHKIPDLLMHLVVDLHSTVFFVSSVAERLR